MLNLSNACTSSDPTVYTFTLTIIDDDLYEGEEYFTLSVIDPQGMEDYTTAITIEDNDRMSVSQLVYIDVLVAII